MDCHVVQESLQVHPSLLAVPGQIHRPGHGPLQLTFHDLAEGVFEVHVDHLAALLLDQMHQPPEPHSDQLKPLRRDLAPFFSLQNRLDQDHLGGDGGDVWLILQGGRNLDDFLAVRLDGGRRVQ
jgi:hypothetical protein